MRLLLVLLVLLVAGAAPAAAHDGDPGGAGVASDVRSSVVATDLPARVTLEVLQNGRALRLRNASNSVVIVDGRRVPPAGVVQWHSDAAHPPGAVGPARPVQPWRVTVSSGGCAIPCSGSCGGRRDHRRGRGSRSRASSPSWRGGARRWR